MAASAFTYVDSDTGAQAAPITSIDDALSVPSGGCLINVIEHRGRAAQPEIAWPYTSARNRSLLGNRVNVAAVFAQDDFDALPCVSRVLFAHGWTEAYAQGPELVVQATFCPYRSEYVRHTPRTS